MIYSVRNGVDNSSKMLGLALTITQADFHVKTNTCATLLNLVLGVVREDG